MRWILLSVILTAASVGIVLLNLRGVHYPAWEGGGDQFLQWYERLPHTGYGWPEPMWNVMDDPAFSPNHEEAMFDSFGLALDVVAWYYMLGLCSLPIIIPWLRCKGSDRKAAQLGHTTSAKTG